MKRISVRKIIGDKSYFRLKKEGISSVNAIKKTPPGKLMSVAGIGPIKAKELYDAVGVKYTKNQIEGIYRNIKDKTRFSKIKKRFTRFAQDPRPQIENLERGKEQLTALYNFLASAKNIGQPIEKKLQLLQHTPATLTLDPFSTRFQTTTEADLYGELTIQEQPDSTLKIIYEANDNFNRRVLREEELLRPQGTSTETMTQLLKIIQDIFDRFRSKTLIGLFVIIVDGKSGFSDEIFNQLINKYGERDTSGNIIEPSNLRIVPSLKDHYSYTAIMKYANNPDFKEIVRRFDNYHAYMYFDEYKRRGGTEKFKDWRSDEEYPYEFFKLIVRSGVESSNVELQSQGLGFQGFFGFLKGIPGADNYQTGQLIPANKIPFNRDLDYKKYVETKRTPNLWPLLEINLHPIMIAMVHATLDDFTIYKLDKILIFESKKIPGIGFSYKEV